MCRSIFKSGREREIEEHRERGHIVYYEIKIEIEEHGERVHRKRERKSW